MYIHWILSTYVMRNMRSIPYVFPWIQLCKSVVSFTLLFWTSFIKGLDLACISSNAKLIPSILIRLVVIEEVFIWGNTVLVQQRFSMISWNSVCADAPSSASSSLHSQQKLVVEDIDSAFSLGTQTEEHITHQVLVEGLPTGADEFVLKLYLGTLIQNVQCTDVKIHTKVAVATYHQPIG